MRAFYQCELIGHGLCLGIGTTILQNEREPGMHMKCSCRGSQQAAALHARNSC